MNLRKIFFKITVSIGRRLQDPLAEYVKMDPKCLGVGMYQHDLTAKSLIDRVNAVLDDCISFVGIDLNHAPLHILQHVSGLGAAKAGAIVAYREKNGPFKLIFYSIKLSFDIFIQKSEATSEC